MPHSPKFARPSPLPARSPSFPQCRRPHIFFIFLAYFFALRTQPGVYPPALSFTTRVTASAQKSLPTAFLINPSASCSNTSHPTPQPTHIPAIATSGPHRLSESQSHAPRPTAPTPPLRKRTTA